MTSMVVAQQISQGYQGKAIISALDLSLPAGVFGLLGPNGAGKSTLIKTLATAIPPQAGSLEVLGTRVDREKSARLVRENIGYLGQSFGAPRSLTAMDYVLYCLWLRGHMNPPVDAGFDALALTGMESEAKTKMKNLSGGMRQRVGISAALAGRPAVILLDEPTVGLDPAQRLQFRKLMRGRNDCCVILSTHLIEDVAAACDSVGVLKDGTFAFTGTPSELESRAGRDVPGDTVLERGYMSVLQRGGAW